MKLNVSYPATGCQKLFEVEDEKKVSVFFEKRMGQEVAADPLGEEWAGYVVRIAGGNDKQGFPMKQGVLTNNRVRLLLSKGHSCYRPRRAGERRRKSVRGCIVDANLSVLALVIVKKGNAEIKGLTDITLPRRLGPKRASKIRKLFNLDKKDDVRRYVIRRPLPIKEGKKPKTKAPKIQRLITPSVLQHRRHKIALKRRRREKNKELRTEYLKLLAVRHKEAREKKLAEVRRRRSSRRSSIASSIERPSKQPQEKVSKKPGAKSGGAKEAVLVKTKQGRKAGEPAKVTLKQAGTVAAKAVAAVAPKDKKTLVKQASSKPAKPIPKTTAKVASLKKEGAFLQSNGKKKSVSSKKGGEAISAPSKKTEDKQKTSKTSKVKDVAASNKIFDQQAGGKKSGKEKPSAPKPEAAKQGKVKQEAAQKKGGEKSVSSSKKVIDKVPIQKQSEQSKQTSAPKKSIQDKSATTKVTKQKATLKQQTGLKQTSASKETAGLKLQAGQKQAASKQVPGSKASAPKQGAPKTSGSAKTGPKK